MHRARSAILGASIHVSIELVGGTHILSHMVIEINVLLQVALAMAASMLAVVKLADSVM